MTHLTIRRAQEAELPATVNVQFINKTADYQTGSQQARRLAVKSNQTSDINLAVVMDDESARNLAESILYTAWVERNSIAFKVSKEYAYLEPTDTIYLTDAESTLTYQVRLTKVSDARNGEIEIECVTDFSPVYHQNISSQPVIVVPEIPIPVSTTTAMMLGLPLLAPADSAMGFYVAMGGQTSSWRGSTLYQSKDDGVTYNPVATFTTASVIGKADSKLNDWKGGNTFDETNSVIVRTNLPLVSLPELSILNGANVAAIGSYGGGWEIIQFRNATLQSDGSYRLSGLLRGRKGTEWAMGGHDIGDGFVLLDNTIQYVNVDESKIGIPLKYKIVAPGQPISSAIAYSIAAPGTALMPFSPVLTGGGKQVDGSFQIEWVRRNRIGGEWVDGHDVPMSEADERYEVDIYTANYASVKRTISVSASSSTVYTPGDQIADFGSEQNELFYAVYQMSTVVGRGYPGWGHLSPPGIDTTPATPLPATIPKPQPA